MPRSTKKGPFVAEHLLQKVNELNARRSKNPIKTWSRASTIIPDFVGHTFEVHNGKEFKRVFVTFVVRSLVVKEPTTKDTKLHQGKSLVISLRVTS